VAGVYQTYEIRCPVHGFIPFDDWEREIVNHDAFQRLRRVRQLAWTDYIYPGAMHTRFEHSLGVMHAATRLFDAVVKNSFELLKRVYGYVSLEDDQLRRTRTIVRLTALLHDTGHSPFSHAGEEVFPVDPLSKSGKPYKHEAYSAAVIRHVLKEAIENHPLNTSGPQITADEIATFLEGTSSSIGNLAFWRQLIDGQMDADRMDYLLRDSLHIGVDYGRYDWRRLLNTIQVIEMPPIDGALQPDLRIGVAEGGFHAAEALVLARYYMFTQVYFHKTRVAYDHHIKEALKSILGGVFPPPTPKEPGKSGIQDYLEWDDWRVLGELAKANGGDHGKRISQRDHYREVYHTPEFPTEGDRTTLNLIRKTLGALVVRTESSLTSAYKLEKSDISVVSEDGLRKVKALSDMSFVVKSLTQKPLEIVRLYSKPEDAAVARGKVDELLK